MNSPSILFLSGASGAGKTSIVEKLKAHYHSSSHYIFLHFDSVGISSLKEMIEQAGSGEKWQELTTYRWVEKIVAEYKDKQIVVIEGQVNLDFIEAACHNFEITRFFIVFIDCDWKTRQYRLIHKRNQPKLVNQNMNNWANFLRKQAQQKKLTIIDTSHQRIDEVMESVYVIILQIIAAA